MNILTKILLLLLLLSLACTNPFAVRDAEPPDPSKLSDNFENPSQVDFVLSNLKYAMEQQNITNYERCFVDEANSFTYRFVHDSRIESGILDNWTLEDEKQYLSHIINSDSLRSISLTLLDSLTYQPISTQLDSQWTSFNYLLNVVFDDSTYVYQGYSKIKFIKDENAPLKLWSIYYWEDHASNNDFANTWSYLKLKFR